MILKDVIVEINQIINRLDFEKYFYWFIKKFQLIDKSKQLNNSKRSNMHPLRPRKGDIYLIEFGQNVGYEINNTHMGIIMQDTKKNIISNTVIVIPISSSPKLYDTHEKILSTDIQTGKLDKLPSKAKTEQITYIDKSRLIHKVGTVTPNFMIKLERRLLKSLGITK